MYYKSWIDKNNMTTYSLDMIRLNYDFGSLDTKNQFIDWVKHIDTFRTEDFKIVYYQSFSSFKYRHLWSFTTKNNTSWSFGLDRGVCKDDNVKGFIEFNPNKTMNDDLFIEFWTKFQIFCINITLSRYDLAIDIPLPRNQCRLLKTGKKMYQLIEKDDGMTEYLGQRSHNGYVKLYDKTIESKLNYELTRLEITFDSNTDIEKVFPEVLIYDLQQELLFNDNFSPTDQTLIALLRQCDDKQIYIKMLGYRMRKKILPYLYDQKLQYDKKLFKCIQILAFSFCKN